MTDDADSGIQIAKILGELTAEVRQLRENDLNLVAAIEKLRDGNKPNWSNYIAAGSLLLLVGGLTFSPVYSSIARLQDNQQATSQALFQIAKDETRVDERLAGLEGRYLARIKEVDRRFFEDVDSRFARLEERTNDDTARLRTWLLNVDHWREGVTRQLGEQAAIERAYHNGHPQ